MFIFVRYLMKHGGNIMLYNNGVWGLAPRSQRMFDAEGELKSPQRLPSRTEINLSESTDNAASTLALMTVYTLTNDYYVAPIVQKE